MTDFITGAMRQVSAEHTLDTFSATDPRGGGRLMEGNMQDMFDEIAICVEAAETLNRTGEIVIEIIGENLSSNFRLPLQMESVAYASELLVKGLTEIGMEQSEFLEFHQYKIYAELDPLIDGE